MFYNSIFIDTQFGGLLWFFLAFLGYFWLCNYITIFDKTFNLFAVGLPNVKKKEVRK